jgi:hypothetical protein
MEHIRYHLWHGYSATANSGQFRIRTEYDSPLESSMRIWSGTERKFAIATNQVIVATAKVLKWWLQLNHKKSRHMFVFVTSPSLISINKLTYFLCVQWFEVRGDFWSCSYCWPSVFKLSVHNRKSFSRLQLHYKNTNPEISILTLN